MNVYKCYKKMKPIAFKYTLATSSNEKSSKNKMSSAKSTRIAPENN